ncbi:uroporphyrinogen decarboxylase family protein [Candidatus Bipolaricaulota bacterium]
MTQTPRERVLAAVNHEEPDRVPIILGVSNATGIKMRTYRALKGRIGVEAEDGYLYDWPELGTAAIDEETMLRLHSDVRGVLDLEPAATRERNRIREPHTPCIDSWGSGQTEIQPGVWFPGLHPLADTTSIDDLEAYPWPDMDDPTRVAHVREEAAKLAAEGQFAIMATPWLLFPFERAFAMQGMDTFLLNMALHPEFAEALLRKNLEMCTRLMGHFLREIGENVDIIKIGDDLGTQESLLISPKMYREVLKPIHAEFVAFIKERTKAKILFHTDGDVFPLIEDFIEIGIDILNPIQTSAGKMSDLAELKTRFGREIVFCGGIDTHHILPSGTPDEVRQETRRVIEILAPGGGYLVSSVHTIMNDVPPENILAMVDAVEELGRYPIGEPR